MKKLWQKHWQLDSFIEAFETKGDLLLDQKLVKCDVLGSLAHIAGLVMIGLFTSSEFKIISKKLLEILELNQKGKFILQAGEEDVHTKIENYLIKKCGIIGKKVHTGRSRNDQVLTAIRLFTKEKLLLIWSELLSLIEAFLNHSQKYEFLGLPGYTHMQKAMPSTVGMWLGAFAEGLLDDLSVLKIAYKLNNQSPLGSAAGYGVPLALDREYTAQLLGFEKVQVNSLYCQNSRGKIEALIVASLIAILSEINRFASDVLLFTTKEFNFFTVAEELCSGSSIMPQKKNIDIAELIRSKIHLVLGNYIQLVSLSSNLISGYNRDLQDSKKPLFESLEVVKETICATTILVNNLTPNIDVLEKSLTPEIFATHNALALVEKGVPFRHAYQRVGKGLDQKIDHSILNASTPLGGINNLDLPRLIVQLNTEKKLFDQEKQKFRKAINNLIQIVGR